MYILSPVQQPLYNISLMRRKQKCVRLVYTFFVELSYRIAASRFPPHHLSYAEHECCIIYVYCSGVTDILSHI